MNTIDYATGGMGEPRQVAPQSDQSPRTHAGQYARTDLFEPRVVDSDQPIFGKIVYFAAGTVG